MLQRSLMIAGFALAVAASPMHAQEGGATTSAVSCDDLNWSAAVLAANPDISQTCRSVYEKDGKLYALAKVEVVRVRGNTMTFRTLHTDGTKGDSRSITLDPGFRANIGGREYRASDLMRGQELNVYLPEDRFALAVQDHDGLHDDDVVEVVEAVSMPTTASPLFLFALAGAAFLGLGGLFGAVRRRQS